MLPFSPGAPASPGKPFGPGAPAKKQDWQSGPKNQKYIQNIKCKWVFTLTSHFTMLSSGTYIKKESKDTGHVLQQVYHVILQLC